MPKPADDVGFAHIILYVSAWIHLAGGVIVGLTSIVAGDIIFGVAAAWIGATLYSIQRMLDYIARKVANIEEHQADSE